MARESQSLASAVTLDRVNQCKSILDGRLRGHLDARPLKTRSSGQLANIPANPIHDVMVLKKNMKKSIHLPAGPLQRSLYNSLPKSLWKPEPSDLQSSSP